MNRCDHRVVEDDIATSVATDAEHGCEAARRTTSQRRQRSIRRREVSEIQDARQRSILEINGQAGWCDIYVEAHVLCWDGVAT